MSIVAIDPSLTATGVAQLSPGPHWELTSIRSKPTANPDAHAGTLRRINGIVDDLEEWLNEHEDRIDLWVMEAPAFSRTTGQVHERAGLWWKLYELGSQRCGRVLVITPNLRAKYATGKGNAGKDEVLLAVSRRYPDAPVTDNNMADAVVLAAMASRIEGRAVEMALPAAHLAALKTLSS